ncbi:hypothetical protein [Variovorax sp. YR752]|uniref:hypothetical protein n=1 Tax=Variovorax sp. YR752 TaxID=1884383 RepID=UPI003137A055
MRPLSPAERQLAGWLDRLVALLLGSSGAVARRLVATVAGRGALLVLDDARLQVEAELDAAVGLQLRLTAGGDDAAARVLTTAAALRAVIDGRRLLDAAVADGSIDLRAPLPELLAFDELVRMALALGPRHAGLRALWAEFEAQWPRGELHCPTLGEQAARHGALCEFVPPVVRHALSPLLDGDNAWTRSPA